MLVRVVSIKRIAFVQFAKRLNRIFSGYVYTQFVLCIRKWPKNTDTRCTRQHAHVQFWVFQSVKVEIVSYKLFVSYRYSVLKYSSVSSVVFNNDTMRIRYWGAKIGDLCRPGLVSFVWLVSTIRFHLIFAHHWGIRYTVPHPLPLRSLRLLAKFLFCTWQTSFGVFADD